MLPLFSQRSRKPLPPPHHRPLISWTSYWTPVQTGSLCDGGISSELFYPGSCPVNAEVLQCSNEAFPLILHKVQHLVTFPLSEYTLCCFATHLADKGLAPQMSKCYLAAVHNTQLSLGLPDPRDQSSLPLLKTVLAGISRSRLSRQSPPRVRLPITGPILTQIHSALQ